jgi:leucyl-tRNA synthetase
MDTFVDSNWYLHRYCDPRNDEAPFERWKVDRWFPVNLYVGGIEHATMHLIYFRFWNRMMHDLGLIDAEEPVTKLLTQGMVCMETLKCPQHGWRYPIEVEDGKCSECGSQVTIGRSEKMSKSKHNLVEPDELLKRYGADTLRLFCLFAAPPEKDLEWSDEGIAGARRFLDRLWRIGERIFGEEPGDGERSAERTDALRRKAHRTVAKVTGDIGRYSLNTAIAAVMELVNECYLYAPVEEPLPRDMAPLREAFEMAVAVLHPFAPHITEELWERLGHDECLTTSRWPSWDEGLARSSTITVPVQVNGKLRGRVDLPADAGEEAMVEAARTDPAVAPHLDGKEIRKTIAVPGRLVNFVVKG